MVRFLCSFLLTLASWAAFAQDAGAEAPVEHASMLTVVIFVVVFVASCVAWGVYTWWHGRNKAERDGT